MAVIKHPEQRVGVFVDIQNMYYSAKNLYQMRVNFGNILERAVSGRKLIRALAYVIKSNNPDEQGFFNALTGQGFSVKMKDLQVYYDGTKKGDWDVGLAMDAVKLSEKIDVAVIVSGDGDYVPLVEYLQYTGVLVEVMAFRESASTKLVEAVDDFTDLSQEQEWYLMKSLKRPIRYLGSMMRRGKEGEENRDNQ